MTIEDLPYSPRVARALDSLRAAFRVLNRATRPMIKSGGGVLLSTPLAGSLLVLRTTGHASGLPREAPLGYALIDGRIVVMAGYGRGTHWFRNALADPAVQVTLPGAVLAGHAEEVTDPQERRRCVRALVRAQGLVGRSALGEALDGDDATVDRIAVGLPVLAITPTAVLPGPFDPGGLGTRVSLAAQVLAGAAAAATAVHVVRSRSCRRRSCCSHPSPRR